jgi:hypothetical protein
MKRNRDPVRELVSELRARAEMIQTIDTRDHRFRPRNATIMQEAADSIERLSNPAPGETQRKIARLCEALEDCAVNSCNPDTCGVCGKHFHECEAETHYRDHVERFDCSGARARKALDCVPPAKPST